METNLKSGAMQSTLTLLISTLLFLSFGAGATHAQIPYFRHYLPTDSNASNEAKCIIKPLGSGVDSLMMAGHCNTASGIPNFSGHTIWTGALGVANAYWNFSVFNEDWSIFYDFVEERTTAGTYNANFPYMPMYSGHPATGFAVYETQMDSTISLGPPHTFVSTINPLSRQAVWNGIIGSGLEEGGCFGKATLVHKDSSHIFYVLSELQNAPSARRTFAITKYAWRQGYSGHQPEWSYRYFTGADEEHFVPTGFIHLDNGEIVVGGTYYETSDPDAVHIFLQPIDADNGAVLAPADIYSPSSGSKLRLNSITGPNSAENLFVLAGSLEYTFPNSVGVSDAIQTPYAITFNQNTLAAVSKRVYSYRASSSSPRLAGEFSCSKISEAPGGSRYLFHVGSVGPSSSWPDTSMALTAKTTLNGGPLWQLRQGFAMESNAYGTKANWLYADHRDSLVYCGKQWSPGYPNGYAIAGMIDKRFAEYTACPEETVVEAHTLDLDEPDPITLDTASWGDFSFPTATRTQPEHRSLQCRNNELLERKAHLEESADDCTLAVSVAGRRLTVKVGCSETTAAEIVVYNLYGGAAAQSSFGLQPGTNVFAANLEGLPSGVYHAVVSFGSHRLSQSFVYLR